MEVGKDDFWPLMKNDPVAADSHYATISYTLFAHPGQQPISF